MLNGERKIIRPLRWGMIGGGRTGQVGYKHRTGALRDNTAYKLVAGAFDLDAQRGREFGIELGMNSERLYDDYQSLLSAEGKRDDGVEVISIATPNFSHFEITMAALHAGIHVICEKPLFFTVAECVTVEKLAEEKGLIVGVTYGFSGHPLVHQMAAMVKKGLLGEIRIVDLQYTHGFNAGDDVDAPDAMKWRTNPATSGPSFVLGDIGTHLYYLSELVVPQLKVKKLLCDRQSFIKSRFPLEDNAYVLSHYDNGAVSRLWVSSVNAGNMGSQRYRFVGSKASVEWSDSHPDQLTYEIQGQPVQILHHGMPYLEEQSLACDRMGALHTEGLGDSWANMYLWIAQAIDAKIRGNETFLKNHHYPGIKAGTEGVRWLENCVRSADNGSAWVEFQ